MVLTGIHVSSIDGVPGFYMCLYNEYVFLYHIAGGSWIKDMISLAQMWLALDHSQDPQRGVAGVLQEAAQLVVQAGNGKRWWLWAMNCITSTNFCCRLPKIAGLLTTSLAWFCFCLEHFQRTLEQTWKQDLSWLGCLSLFSRDRILIQWSPTCCLLKFTVHDCFWVYSTCNTSVEQ